MISSHKSGYSFQTTKFLTLLTSCKIVVCAFCSMTFQIVRAFLTHPTDIPDIKQILVHKHEGRTISGLDCSKQF